MPNYDHTCEKCKKDFVIEMKISEVDKKRSPVLNAVQKR